MKTEEYFAHDSAKSMSLAKSVKELKYGTLAILWQIVVWMRTVI